MPAVVSGGGIRLRTVDSLESVAIGGFVDRDEAVFERGGEGGAGGLGGGGGGGG